MSTLQKLSLTVNKKANQLIKQIIMGLCILAGIAVVAIVLSNTIKNNEKEVKIYSSQIDTAMSEKMAFIRTVAAGASSGTVTDYANYVDMMVSQYDDVPAVYVCVKETGVVYKDGIMTYMSGGWVPDSDFMVSERAWYIGALECDDVYVSEPYVDEQSGNICITLSKKILKGNEVIGVTGLDMYIEDLVALMEGSYKDGNYVFLTSKEGTIMTHPDQRLALTAENAMNVQDALNGKYKSVCAKALKTKLILDYKGGFKFAICDSSDVTGWNVVAVISLAWVVFCFVVIVLLTTVLGILIGRIAKSSLMKTISPMFSPLEDLSVNVSKISEGVLDYSFHIDEQSEEVNALSVALNDTMQDLKNYITEITNTVTAISEKNLSFKVDGNFAGDYARIKDALVDILQVLNQSFFEMNEQVTVVMEFAKNLADTSENVARSATTQSEAVNIASAEMKNLKDNMEKIADYTGAIKNNTNYTNECLTVGNEEMKALVKAMDDIEQCYDEIAGFVSEISEIASQTNLLALNASIEAARAGESGRGFAVVADEIGALSNSSSESSAKISEAITRSLQSVEQGKNLVIQTEKTISECVGYSSENTRMVMNIVDFVETQNASADEISVSLRKISEMVENNAASAQENSSISVSLGDCAKGLMDTISQFKLQE